jgi:hypothetical protein
MRAHLDTLKQLTEAEGAGFLGTDNLLQGAAL